MELPFTIVFEPPSWSELRALLRMRGHWVAGLIVALTIGTAYVLANSARADAGAAAGAVPLELHSQPAGALVWLDGQARGRTPAELTTQSGQHTVLLKARDAIEVQYALDVPRSGGRLDAVLWKRQTGVTRLRAALPGATLADARLLNDDQVGLSIGVPPGRQLEAWRLDARTGALESVATGIPGPRLAFAPDGRHLAYIGAAVGPPRTSGSFGSDERPATVVWLISSDGDGPSAAWRAPIESPEELVDLSWSPRGDQLLVFSKQVLSGGALHSRAWLIDADGQGAQPLLSLPSEVVPGSEAWSPDGGALVFVAHVGELNALCGLRIDGAFRYLADLDSAAAPPLGYAPAAWSADGQRIAFVAPHQYPPGVPRAWLQPDFKHAVYIATLDDPTPRAVGDTEADLVTWREDGQLLGLVRAGSDGWLNVRLLNSSSATGQQILQLPLRPSDRYAAMWDLRRARVLMANQTAAGAIEYWLASLGLDSDG